MSRHSFKTEIRGEKVEVTAGWSKNQGKFFVEAELTGEIPHGRMRGVVLGGGDFQTNFTDLLVQLNDNKIFLPPEMLKEIGEDGLRNAGNKIVDHAMVEGMYVRKVYTDDSYYPDCLPSGCGRQDINCEDCKRTRTKLPEFYTCASCGKKRHDSRSHWCDAADNIICDDCCKATTSKEECTYCGNRTPSDRRNR